MTAQPLHVVICSDNASINGGQAKVAIESALSLKARGVEPILFAAAGPVDPRLAEAGVEVVCLGQHELIGNPSRAAALLQGTWNFGAASALKALLQRLPRSRTIVHVHAWAKALSPSIVQAIRASGAPALYTVHEYFLFCPNGGFYNYQANHVCSLVPMSAACLGSHCDQRNYVRKVWRFSRLALARSLAHMPEAFSDYITISDYQAEIVAPYLPRGARVHRLSNPVETLDPGLKEEPASGDFVFVGRLSPEKGPLLFAQAAARAGLRAVFVGDGPMAEEIRVRHPEAVLLGWLPAAEARETLRRARALVFPSVWYEGQPLSVLEAKSMGTPVIVSDICAGRDEIEDGVDGLWFRSGDVEQLARAMTRLADDATVARFSRNAYESYWRRPPTADAHLEGLLAIYNEMLSRRRLAA